MDKQDLYKVEIELCRIVLDANELDQLSILYRQLKEAVEDKRTCQFCKHDGREY